MSKTTRYVPKEIDWMVPDYKVQYFRWGVPKPGTPRRLPRRGKGRTFCSCCYGLSRRSLKNLTNRYWRRLMDRKQFLDELTEELNFYASLGPNHKDDCKGDTWKHSGENYNRVRVCECGAEDHDPELR